MHFGTVLRTAVVEAMQRLGDRDLRGDKVQLDDYWFGIARASNQTWIGGMPVVSGSDNRVLTAPEFGSKHEPVNFPEETTS